RGSGTSHGVVRGSRAARGGVTVDLGRPGRALSPHRYARGGGGAGGRQVGRFASLVALAHGVSARDVLALCRELVGGVERRDFVALGERRVIEHGLEKVVEAAAQA